MKFASFDRVISPEVGACIAGYGVNQHSVCKADDLRDALFPEDAAKDKPCPDFVVRPLVDIPKNGL